MTACLHTGLPMSFLSHVPLKSAVESWGTADGRQGGPVPTAGAKLDLAPYLVKPLFFKAIYIGDYENIPWQSVL